MRFFLAVGLLIIFGAVALGCGSGLMPAMPGTHGADKVCSGAVASMFAVSHKDLDAMQSFALLISALVLLAGWVLALRPASILRVFWRHRLQNMRRRLLRQHDYLLRLISTGILHPNIY